MQVHTEDGIAPIKMWTDGVEVEDAAMQQLRNVAGLPFIHKHVAVMPDVHWGMGATIGSVIPTVGAIIPAAVGVDLGCGMVAQRTTLTASDLPDNLHGLRSAIEERVPHGRSANGGPGDVGAWRDVPAYVGRAWSESLLPTFQYIVDRHPRVNQANTETHLGTLGTGNHFVEVCLDEDQRVWIMLHSGSRGVGNRIGSYFIGLAKEEMRRWYVNLPDMDLSYLPEGSQHFQDYIDAVHWAQQYAALNREIMLNNVVEAFRAVFPQRETLLDTARAINCHHNYVSRERHFGKNVWLTRKGAVSANHGELGIIPGSMGAKSFIVRGKGNREAFCSCSHGAGRRMSRGAAKKAFTVADHEIATAGIECRKDEGVLDETPGAYKDIDSVMSAQDDLVEVVQTLRQVVCVKG